MAAEVPTCRLCGLEAKSVGRKHGNQVYCTSCNTVDTMVRRNLGAVPSLNAVDTADFFKKVAEAKKDNPRQTWTTVRAMLKERMVRSKVRESERAVTGEARPLQYWLNLGYEEAMVKQFEDEEDPKLGVLYSVPVKSFTVREIERDTEEEMLMRESEVRRKKQARQAAAGDRPEDPAWDIPAPAAAAAPAGKGDRVPEEKSEAALARAKAKAEKARKSQTQRDSILAGKAISLLTPKLQSINNALRDAEKKPGASTADVECLQQGWTKLDAWNKASKQLVAAVAMNPDAETIPLPYDKIEFKAALDAASACLKKFRGDMRRAADEAEEQGREEGEQPKAPKRKPAGKAAAAKPPAKRLRVKQTE